MNFTTSLRKNHEFKRLYNKGLSAASQCAAVYCKSNKTAANRLGITVSTKLGGAVVRNRIRRRLKEIYRINETKLAAGFDIVIVARTKSREAEFNELEASVLALLRKLKLTADGNAVRNKDGNVKSGRGGARDDATSLMGGARIGPQ